MVSYIATMAGCERLGSDGGGDLVAVVWLGGFESPLGDSLRLLNSISLEESFDGGLTFSWFLSFRFAKRLYSRKL